MGIGSMSARIGSVLAPFAVQLWQIIEDAAGFDAPDGPLLLFGSAGIIAGVVGFALLPETRGITTPETVADLLHMRAVSRGRCSC